MISLRYLVVSIGLISFLAGPIQQALSQSTARVRVSPGDNVVILDSIRGEIELQVFSGRSPRDIAIQNSSSVNVMVTVPCGASRDVFPLAQGYTSFVRVPSGVRFCVVSVTANNGRALRR